jgi:nicotinamidase-related amidase
MNQEDIKRQASENRTVPILDKNNSLLLVIDVQEKLVPAISGIDVLLTRLQALVRGARTMNVPMMFTEHCPDRIGFTVDPICELASNATYVHKTYFGAVRVNEISEKIKSEERCQIVIAGTEAHVCVMQTALGLLEQGYDVFLVIDGIGSREPQDMEIAIERLCLAGAIPVTSEMVLFEWLEHADVSCFREVLGIVKALGK